MKLALRLRRARRRARSIAIVCPQIGNMPVLALRPIPAAVKSTSVGSVSLSRASLEPGHSVSDALHDDCSICCAGGLARRDRPSEHRRSVDERVCFAFPAQ
jgi:hypothetical protein